MPFPSRSHPPAGGCDDGAPHSGMGPLQLPRGLGLVTGHRWNKEAQPGREGKELVRAALEQGISLTRGRGATCPRPRRGGSLPEMDID